MTRLHTFVKPCIRSAVEQMQKELISTKGFFSRHLPSLHASQSRSSRRTQCLTGVLVLALGQATRFIQVARLLCLFVDSRTSSMHSPSHLITAPQSFLSIFPNATQASNMPLGHAECSNELFVGIQMAMLWGPDLLWELWKQPGSRSPSQTIVVAVTKIHKTL